MKTPILVLTVLLLISRVHGDDDPLEPIMTVFKGFSDDVQQSIKAVLCDGKASGRFDIVAQQSQVILERMGGSQQNVRSAICSAGVGHLSQGSNSLLLQATIALAAVVFIMMAMPL